VLFTSYVLAKKALSYEKRAHKMLMKLTSAGISNLLLHRLDCWIQGRCRELKATSVFSQAKLSKTRHCLNMCAELDIENKCMTVTFSGKENKCLFFTKVCEKIDVTGKYCFITMKYFINGHGYDKSTFIRNIKAHDSPK